MKGMKLLTRLTIVSLLLLAVFAISNPGGSSPHAYAACPASTYPTFGYDTGRTSYNPLECVISPLVAPPFNWASGFLLPTTSREGISTDANNGYVASGNSLLAFKLLTGALLWAFPTTAAISGAATVFLGNIYIGSTNGTFFALNPAGGLICAVALGVPIATTSIGFANSLLVTTTNSRVFAVNAGTCAIMWATPVLGTSITSPSLSGGTALVSVQVNPANSLVVAINAATGAIVGNSPALPGTFTAPATRAGQIYVGSNNAAVGVIDFKLVLPGLPVAWVTPIAGDPILGKPAVDAPAAAASQVYVVSGTTNKLFALNAITGAINWAAASPCAPLYKAAAPTVANGGVYVGGTNCINAFKTTGGPTWAIGVGPLVDTPATVANGQILFSVNLGANERVFSF